MFMKPCISTMTITIIGMVILNLAATTVTDGFSITAKASPSIISGSNCDTNVLNNLKGQSGSPGIGANGGNGGAGGSGDTIICDSSGTTSENPDDLTTNFAVEGSSTANGGNGGNGGNVIHELP